MAEVVAALSKSASDSKLFKSEACSKNIGTNTFGATDMDMWPLLSLVSPSLREKIILVYVFGPSGSEMIFTTLNDEVC